MAEKFGRKVKELMVSEMKSIFTENKGFVFSTVENIKASEMDVLRKKMKHSGSRYFVVKNRLAKIALDEAGIDGLNDVVSDQKIIGVGVIEEDPVNIAKLLMEFSKQSKGFTVSKGYLEGRVLESEKIKELSELPSREQLLAMVLRAMNGPISGFVGVLSAIPRKFLYALNALKEKREKGE